MQHVFRYVMTDASSMQAEYFQTLFLSGPSVRCTQCETVCLTGPMLLQLLEGELEAYASTNVIQMPIKIVVTAGQNSSSMSKTLSGSVLLALLQVPNSQERLSLSSCL